MKPMSQNQRQRYVSSGSPGANTLGEIAVVLTAEIRNFDNKAKTG